MKFENLGPNVREILNSKGISQARLAELMGVKPCTLSLLLSGRRGTSEETLKRMADALGVPVEELNGSDDGIGLRKAADQCRKDIPGFHLASFRAGYEAAMASMAE